MQHNNQFTLIQGKFTVEDAKSILFNFYNTKINFHNLQLIAIHEGKPGDAREIEQKVSALKQVKQEISSLLSAPDFANELLEIEGHITIKR
ncbi:hypothetical protein [Pedobacter suwonensis]|uniref:hypothetical protein n=1 Tax=Pedobacter suwonensis TaxID=332999 RepID=UPI0011A24774|nr:hypothetical protein [Pedobacter suwonensis]